MHTKGQNPPFPALMGKNKTPAPTAVPNKFNAQTRSNLLQLTQDFVVIKRSMLLKKQIAPKR
ncbi:hypothetical protein VM82_02325 [Pasteurella multocida]|nr:hypothetical protein VM82_02325 [Pasteurella multocida]WGE14665.1 hypothetical protein PM3_1297 [Pasteurella multocida]